MFILYINNTVVSQLVSMGEFLVRSLPSVFAFAVTKTYIYTVANGNYLVYL